MECQNNSKGEHYNLRWNNYTNNLLQVFSEHQHQETLVDVTLTCEGQYIKAHRIILSACSGFFQEMFKTYGSVPNPFIVLNGIKFNHFKHILQFIYHGEIKILDADLEGVLALGESFQVKGLSSVKLKHQISSQNEPHTIPLTSTSTNLSGPQTAVQNVKPVPEPVPKNEALKSVLKPTEYRSKTASEHLAKDSKRVQVINRTDVGSGVNVQNKASTTSTSFSAVSTREQFSTQNRNEESEPANKRVKTPEIKPATFNNGNVVIENKRRENKTDSGSIPKPANAFMIFAAEWRKKLAVEHPNENNKEISVRLGNMWKALSIDTKDTYYAAAEKAQEEHELKYPEYKYVPLQGRKRKAARRRTIDSVTHLATADIAEYEDDDDLQIIEINEDPIDITN